MYFHERLTPRVSSTLNLARWVAAELVLVSHIRGLVLVTWSEVPASERNPLLWLLFAGTSLGHQAVVVFFVMSGFLVGGSVLSEVRADRFSMGRYLVNRISRLYVVLLPALALGWTLDRIGLRAFAESGIYSHKFPHELLSLNYDVGARLGAATWIANAVNLQTISAPTLGSNGPLWSLANEFWYYLLFPAALLPFVAKRRWARAAWAAVALAAAWLVYPNILAYALIWLLGVAVRLIPRIRFLPPWLTALAIFPAAAACARIQSTSRAPGAFFLADMALALLFLVVLLGSMHERRSDALPGAKTHERLAGFSYSLYLLHFPFVLLTTVWVQSTWGHALSQRPGTAPFLIMAALFVAANLYAWTVAQATERHTASVRRWLMMRAFPTISR
ncbi:MAG: acyltransferase family protein [Polyangiaceae bacterium]